jgi:hypothetical protein
MRFLHAERLGLMDFLEWSHEIISLYNETMGGTDAFDQRLECYRPKVKTVSWKVKVYCHFLNAAVVNAYILHLQIHNLD